MDTSQTELLGMKTIMFGMKNILDGIKNGSDVAGEKTSELENVAIEAIQN